MTSIEISKPTHNGEPRPAAPRRWWKNGRLHRLGGPAVIWADGSQEWYVCGQRHRIDGPAVIWIDGTQEWFVRGQNITRNVIHWMQLQNITWPWDLPTQMQFQLTWT